MNEHDVFTHAEWRVRPGREDEFVAAWKDLAAAFSSLERPPLWGTLLRSEAEPSVFYSFGPWRSAEDVAAMRADANAQTAMRRVMDLCETATPGACRLVLYVDVPGPAGMEGSS